MANTLSVYDIAKMIDHSLLRPQLTEQEFVEGVEFSKENKVATCCVVPFDVIRTVELLKGSDVPVSTVAAFPHGTIPTKAKVNEAILAITSGVIELDMVMAISRMLAGDFDYVEQDIRAVVDVAHKNNVCLKVILETCYLTDELIAKACSLCENAGADYVKTSTGYGTAGATLEHVRIMRKSCSSRVKIKAAGGIRTLDEVLAFRANGVDRIATRSTPMILREALDREAQGILTE